MSNRVQRLFVNALTFSRVPFIFAFSVVAVMAHRASDSIPLGVLAGVLMFLAGISDLFDGMLARRWKVVSAFGKMADPLMDKVFFIVSFPTLLWLIGAQGDNAAHAMTMLAFTILYILRDQWVTFLRSVASLYGADVAAMWLGKVRTALSFPAAGWVYAYLAYRGAAPAAWDGPWLASVYAVEGAMILINAWSFVVYTRAYMPYVRKALGMS